MTKKNRRNYSSGVLRNCCSALLLSPALILLPAFTAGIFALALLLILLIALLALIVSLLRALLLSLLSLVLLVLVLIAHGKQLLCDSFAGEWMARGRSWMFASRCMARFGAIDANDGLAW